MQPSDLKSKASSAVHPTSATTLASKPTTGQGGSLETIGSSAKLPATATQRRMILKFIPVTKASGLLGAALVLIAAVGAVLVFGKVGHKTGGRSGSIGALSIGNQNLTADQLNKFYSASGSGTSQNVLTISPNTVFNGSLRVQQDLLLSGKLTTTGPLTVNGLTVSGAGTLDGLNVTGPSALKGGATVSKFLNVNGNVDVVGNGSFSGNLAANAVTAQSFNIGTLSISGHINTSGPTPVVGAGGGTGGGSARIVGNDSSGTLIIDTGAHPGAGDLANVSFKTNYSNYPKVILTPVGINAPALQYYTSRNPSSFSLLTLNSPAPNTEYVFDYIVAQ